MTTAVAVAVLLAIVALGYVLMWRGWRRHRDRYSDLPPLPDALAAAPEALAPVDVVHLGTTVSGQWLARVGAHALHIRGTASVRVTDAGVTLERPTAPTVPIAADAVRGVRLDRAGGGRAVRHPEYVIITWEHGEHLLDTALRPQRRADVPRLMHAVHGVTQGVKGIE